MKKAIDMTQEQLFKSAKRVVGTLKTTHKNDSINNKRFQDRAARFDELKSFVIDCGWWVLFCQFLEIDPSSDGHDFLG